MWDVESSVPLEDLFYVLSLVVGPKRLSLDKLPVGFIQNLEELMEAAGPYKEVRKNNHSLRSPKPLWAATATF
jgi:hypothetical protein